MVQIESLRVALDRVGPFGTFDANEAVDGSARGGFEFNAQGNQPLGFGHGKVPLLDRLQFAGRLLVEVSFVHGRAVGVLGRASANGLHEVFQLGKAQFSLRVKGGQPGGAILEEALDARPVADELSVFHGVDQRICHDQPNLGL